MQMRVISGIVFVVAVFLVVLNVIMRRSKNWQRLQGTLGTINAVGGAFRR
jgi:hypothetical protein